VVDERREPAAPAARVRETAIARVMTSTSIDKHPTAFFTTGLPILQVALDVAAMSEVLEPLLAPVAADGGRATVRYARLVAYKPGNRGLVHYEVEGASTPFVVGKLYPEPAQSARVAGIMQLLWSTVFRPGVGFGVPQPLGHVPDLSMLVYVPVEGPFSDEVCHQEGADVLFERAGRWLAALHGARLVLDRRYDAARELDNVDGWTLEIGRHDAGAGRVAGAVAAWLREQAPDVELETHVPIHKDFHHRHLIVGDAGHVTVIDHDEMRLGDPVLDVAHFVAHLELLGARTPVGREGRDRFERAFLEAYAATSRWTPDERYPFFLAYSYLKMARQLVAVRGIRPRPEGDEMQRELGLVLERAAEATRWVGP
jgi:hypothetical protein